MGVCFSSKKKKKSSLSPTPHTIPTQPTPLNNSTPSLNTPDPPITNYITTFNNNDRISNHSPENISEESQSITSLTSRTPHFPRVATIPHLPSLSLRPILNDFTRNSSTIQNNTNSQNAHNINIPPLFIHNDLFIRRDGRYCNQCHMHFPNTYQYEEHLPCPSTPKQNNISESSFLSSEIQRALNGLECILSTNAINLVINDTNEYIDWYFNKTKRIWHNKGKISLEDKEIEDISKINEKDIKYSKFYKKRIWFEKYINNNIYDKNTDNATLVVKRDNILEESYNQFMTIEELNLKGTMRIFFIDEVALDAGGVYREWYNCLFKEIFSEKYNFFIRNSNEGEGNGTYLIPISEVSGDILSYYEFIGKIIAKALLDKITIEAHLNYIILKHLICYEKREFTLNDLYFFDNQIYTSLTSLLRNDVRENKDLMFIWEVNGNDIELIPNGKAILINNINKVKFSKRVIEYVCYESIKDKVDRIKKGFFSVIGEESVMQIFTIEEFDFILSGQSVIDLNDWKNNTIYQGYYDENYPTIIKFWDVLGELTQEELLAFYKFCTGATTVPLDGFSVLQGPRNQVFKFCIQSPCEEDKDDNDRLIEAKTCFNEIYLPEYHTKEKIRKVIKTIINNDTNFFGMK